jgi:putative PIN family toxin of toxin-antitoxin system
LEVVRILLDTNILVRANPKSAPQGLARELLLTPTRHPNILLISSPILVEIERVLSYPHVAKRWPLSFQMIQDYLFLLERVSLFVDVPVLVPAVVSDPDDDPILQTAILGKATVLCSLDVAFHHERVREVCRLHEIRILDDVTLMRELRGSG